MMLIRNMILISLAIAVCAVPDAPDDIVPENMPEEKFYDQAVEQEFTNEKSSNDATRSELEVNDIVRPSSESSVLQEITSEFPKASFEEITNKVSEEITCQPGTYVKMEEPRRPSMGRYGRASSHVCRYIKMRDPGCCDGGQGRMCDYARRGGCCPKEEATKTCRGCGSGKYAAGTDAAECLECAVGTFSSGNKAASCEDCPIGKSSPEGKPGSYWCLADQCIAAQGTCTFDSSTPGALQDGGCCSGKCNERGYCCKGMFECPPPVDPNAIVEKTGGCIPGGKVRPPYCCNLGQAYIGGLQMKCMDCPAGRFASSKGLTWNTCFPCPPGTWSSAGATKCNHCPASASISHANICVSTCPAGWKPVIYGKSHQDGSYTNTAKKCCHPHVRYDSYNTHPSACRPAGL